MNDIMCVILARKGSKRLPNKHMRYIGGIPLIKRAYNKVLEARLFDNVILSTDCPDCITQARCTGIDIIERHPELCTDDACMANAFRDAVQQSIGIYGKLHRWGCLFMPTHFLISTDFLHRMYRIISNISDDNPRASDQPWSAVIPGGDSALFPWFYDLRPGAVACRRKVLDYHDTKGELCVNIDTARDLEQARLIYNFSRGFERD